MIQGWFEGHVFNPIHSSVVSGHASTSSYLVNTS